MSILVMTRVWESYPAGGSELLAMLALADWSNDAGVCFPSISAIANKTRLSRSQARRVVHGLIDAGYLAVVENSTGGAPGMTRRYRINLEKLTGSADARGRMDASPTGSTGATGSAGARGRMGARDGSHGCAKTGSAGATQTVIEPSGTTKERGKPAGAGVADPRPHREVIAPTPSKSVTFSAWLEMVKASGERAITDHGALWKYSHDIGLPEDWVWLAWRQFRRRYQSDPEYRGKRYKEWRQVFRNAVEQNWFKLWVAVDGGYRLTTQGIQAQREVEAQTSQEAAA